MYLYTPIDGRSIAVGEFIISSTGMAFSEPVLCLEEVIGKLLKRSSEDWNMTEANLEDITEVVTETTAEVTPEITTILEPIVK